MEKQVVEGEKLPNFDKVDPDGGFGYQKFFKGYFQTVGKQPHEDGAIKITSQNPKMDNLSIVELTKANALRNGDIEKFNQIQEGIISSKDLSLDDILDPESLEASRPSYE